MKLKKQYKIILGILIIAFIGLSIFLITKKEKVTTTKKTSSANEYLISYNNPSAWDKDGCKRYYKDSGNRIYTKDEVSEGYPIYTVNSCATTLSDYILKTKDKENACAAEYAYVTQDAWHQSDEVVVKKYNDSCSDSSKGTISVASKPDTTSFTCEDPLKETPKEGTTDTDKWPYYGIKGYDEKIYGYSFVDYFNRCPGKQDNACKIYKEYVQPGGSWEHDGKAINEYNSYCGSKTGNVNTISWSGLTCSELQNKLKTEYVDYRGEEKWYNDNCSEKFDTSQITRASYFSDSSKCESLKFNDLFTGILKKNSIDSRNACDYDLYYIDGYATTLEDYLSKGGELEDSIDVVFSTNDGSGMKCIEKSTEQYVSEERSSTECVYHFKKDLANTSVTINQTDLPNTSNLKQLTTYASFDGWSDGTNCLKNTSLTIQLPENAFQKIITPCYKVETKLSQGATLYKSCSGDYESKIVEKKSDGTSRTLKEDGGTVNVDNTALLTSEINTEQDYKTTENKKSETKSHGNDFLINQFCSITCKETVNYKYPTIFETVKSGTYFDLLSYPEMISSLTCTENFNYDDWLRVYEERIENEKKLAVATENSYIINSLSSFNTNCSSVNNCDCDEFGCHDTTCTSSVTIFDYKQNQTTYLPNNIKVSSCGYDATINRTKKEARRRAGIDSRASDKYLEEYNASKDLRKKTETMNYDCVYAMAKEKKSVVTNTDNEKKDYEKSSDAFYNVIFSDSDDSSTKITLKYDDASSVKEEVLGISNSSVKDTDIHDYDETDLSIDDNKSININYSVGGTTTNETFSSIDLTKLTTSGVTTDYFQRTVERIFTFNHSKTHPAYYALSGIGYQKNSEGTLITKENLDDKGEYNGIKAIRLGYVYPIKLANSGTKNVSFTIQYETNLDYGAEKLIGKSATNKAKYNEYSCTYDISNDIIVEDTNNDEEKDFKKNFYVRSVDTSNVDPNNRFKKGLLGANWSDDKGQALIKLIQDTESNTTSTKNTYTHDNLEYSFTINAQTIAYIKSYNENNDYDDFKLDCNNVGGECKSKFLETLSKDSSVNAYMKRENDPTWKYYIKDKWVTVNSLSELKKYDTESLCDSKIDDSKEYYDCLYRKVNEGVLP